MDGMLSQEEINALLGSMGDSAENTSDVAASEPTPAAADSNERLSPEESDALGEIANISMGTAATTLSILVNNRVEITTPKLSYVTLDDLKEQNPAPCVFIYISYRTGLEGKNILVLKEHDVKVITDLMMGGDGTNTDGELGELHLSAISEAMNQMMGSAATSLSTLLQTVIDISPPESSLFDLTEVKDGKEISPFLGGTFVKIAFRMQIDDLVDSSIMQLYPIDFARKLVETFINTQMGSLGESNDQAATQPESIPAPAAAPQNNAGQMNAGANNMTQMNMQQPDPMAMNHMNGMNQMGNMGMPQMNGMNQTGGMGMNQMPGMDMNSMNQMGMNGMPQMGMQQMGNMGMQQMNGMGMMNQMGNMGMPQQNVNVQPAQFQSFSNDSMGLSGQENIGLIKDVPLEVTVELGRTTKSISEILEFSPGTIIELDRIAGEPIDVLVNGKFVAKGEVVVIEESFGVRITEIIK